MKTRLLIALGIIIAIAISITYVSIAYNQEIKLATGMMTGDEKSQPSTVSDPVCFVVDRTSSDNIGSAVTLDTCISLKQFEEMGCTKPMLDHLTKYSNLLDEEFDGKYAIEDKALPDGVSKEKFQECVDFIYEKRILMEPERLNKVLRLCENTDAQPLGALVFENSTHHIDSQTCMWRLLNEN